MSSHSNHSSHSNKFDVIIIGGGIVGTSILRELSRYRLSLCLLEKEAELSFGVSKSNSGIVHAGFHSEASTLKGRLCARGNFLYDELYNDLGIPFKRVGELVVIKDSSEIEELEKFKRWGEECGVPDMLILNKKEVHQYEPNLGDNIEGALWAPTAGVVNPYEFVYFLAENAKKNGAQIKTAEEVISICEMVGKGKKGENLLAVQTTKERYETSFVINAAGLYGDRIAGMLGINDFKIIPRKGEEYLLDRKLQGIVKHIIFPLPSKTSKGTLVIPTLDGTIMVGPSAEDVPDKNDLKTTDEICWQIFSKASEMIPSMNSRYLISTFAGNRPVAYRYKEPQNDDFIIGPTKIHGFINAAGIQSPGLTAAPAIAEMIVSIVSEECKKINKELLPNEYFVKTNPHIKKIRDMSDEELDQKIKDDPDFGKVVCRCEMVSEGEIIR
ncbi:MAG: NAD(P)/FAD-dependent oxidoreductase, partial [Oligoflexia bacterium]|nr:NAD(P)/FAD-dependent oxidoreductase [Oligoflexia bacterium]